MEKVAPIRLLLVEDQVLVRESLRSVLETNPNFQLIGEACDGEEAIGYVERFQPHVVLMDINMPRMDGVAATRQIKAKHPTVAIVGITITADGYHQMAMRRAGAFEILSKGKTSLNELYATLEQAASSTNP
jgi:DNA-binding NarL/FixJ family response regulator